MKIKMFIIIRTRYYTNIIKKYKGGDNLIEHVINIGNYIKERKNEDIVSYLVNEVNPEAMESTLILDVRNKDSSVKATVEIYSESIIKKALFYQAGNAFLGGGLRLDFYKESEKGKFEKKIKEACKYCGVENSLDNVKAEIYKYIKAYGTKAFAIIRVDGQFPIDLFKEKFIKKIYSQFYSEIEGQHVCHFCDNVGTVYNSVIYKFYTNDKSIYSNIKEDGKSGVAVCKDCLEAILIGKKYAEDNLTGFWLGKNVLFLPHVYDEEIESIYQTGKIAENAEHSKLLENIKNMESDVLDEVGRSNANTDIIFFEAEGQRTFYIYHNIKSIMPSRFTFIGKKLEHYDDMKLFQVIKFAASTRVEGGEEKSTFKDRMKILDSIFSGKPISRNDFFKNSMNVYRRNYIQGTHRKYAIIKNTNKAYNFLVDCGCLKGGFDVMVDYSSPQELFANNKSYFDTNEKMAWFMLGNTYSYVNYMIREKLKGNSESESKEKIKYEKTSLDKNFFFARKFDFKDFIYFCNLLNDKVAKYGVYNNKFKNMISEAKGLISKNENKLSNQESKYLFFWGMDMYFKGEKNDTEVNEQVEETLDDN